MADAREDRVMSAMYSVPTGGPPLASQQQCTTPGFSLHTCLQTTVDHPSPTTYQRNTQLIPTYIVRKTRPTMSCSCLVIMTRDFVT